MKHPRKIKEVFKSMPVLEGAGVHLRRGFGHREAPLFDPFLLFDDFRSEKPEHFLKGFPWHPHRGIETITYVLRGDVEHEDSLGNKGVISSGDVQWMTAGSGIIHQEMPKGDPSGKMEGFQLWANLPAARKMMEPRYRDIRADRIPQVKMNNGTSIRIICGQIGNITGPAQDIIIDPEYLDITIPENGAFTHPTPINHTVMAYVIEGSGYFEDDRNPDSPLLENHHLVLFDRGDHLTIRTASEPVRLLLISGNPIGEPIAWRGPIVMNTEEELQTAFDEYRQGTFIKHKINRNDR